ncbi:MAG: EAL domain-containing protein [Methylophilaceae bacterium]|nr:EAL domain-containing protein [Methylophilaceae bacterium]
MIKGVPTSQFHARWLLAGAVAVIVLCFVGTQLTPSKPWLVFFDNLHWTVSTLAAAALAWLGVRQASGLEREARRWFFRGLAAYACGQVCYDLQVYTGWNPFPAPADLFYLMLGPGCTAGLLVCLRGRLSPAGLRALVLDFFMFAVPVLLLVLLLYLPQAANATWLQLATYTAYPLFFLMAACLGGLAMLHLRPRPDWPWLALLAALVADGILWMLWNEQLLNAATQDGALLNLMFSPVELVLGLAMMHWRLTPAEAAHNQRRYETLQRLLPLVAIVLMSLVVAQSWLLPSPPLPRALVMGVALLVLVLAVLRQTVLLVESKRLLEAEEALRVGEARLRRLNRLYAAALRSIEAMLRFKDDQALMAEICRIAVEQGGMSLAWIGVQEQGTSRILPVARHGVATDYIDGINVSVDADVPEGRGPTGTALREGRVVVNASFRTNPAMAPWRQQAMCHGWGSSAAFPILRGGKPYAVLSVYHTDEGAFDGQIVRLLEDMVGSLAFALDKLDQVRAQEEADRKLRLAARVFEEAHEGITITDASGTIIDVNPMFCEITGYSREEVIGQNPRILSSGRQSTEFYRQMWQSLEETGHWRGEIWNRRKNGEVYAELLTISALRDEAGQTQYYIGLFSDITYVKHQQETLELMAHYDPLTRLPNRVLFADRLSQAMARCKRENNLLALCYLDLDGFKQVNDTLGHEMGDRLLVQVAERIRSNLREGDTVSRLGGDEFVLLLGELDGLEQCEQALKRIHRAIAQPYYLDGKPVTVGASTGVTLYPLDDADADTLLRHADQAMYQAKAEGRNRYFLFDAERDQVVQSRRQHLSAIEQAFSRNEFCLYYQPKVDMQSGKVIGAEALIRWQHPERGLVPPSEFLPVVEGTAFEIVLGNWVMDEALRQLQAWRAAGLDLQVSINISPQHLQWTYFFNQLEATLAMYPAIPSDRLQLEVLESSVLGDLNTMSQILKSCRDGLGVSIALDDFGTGYSSLTHLRHLPAHVIKIDQSFVRNMVDDPNDAAIVEGVVSLSRTFHRQAVAEGVETRDHGLMLLIMGCTLAQGYGVARPMPPEALPDWARNYQPDAKWRDYAQHPPSPRQAQVLLLLIEASQWLRRMEDSLYAEPHGHAHWPIMNGRHCHMGRWLQYVEAEQGAQFDPVLLARLKVAHDELHHLGNQLMQLHQAGHLAQARAGIAQLRALDAQIQGILHLLV